MKAEYKQMFQELKLVMNQKVQQGIEINYLFYLIKGRTIRIDSYLQCGSDNQASTGSGSD